MWLSVWLAQQSIENAFLERGVLGAIVLVLGTFAWISIKQLRTDLSTSLQRERDQQAQIYTKVIPLLERLSATVEAKAIMDQAILDALKDVRKLLELRKE